MSLEYSVFLSCVTTSGIIGIILIASTLNLMDKQISNISKNITDQKSNGNSKIPMNLVCSEAFTYGVWNYFSFVYNEKDPSGTDLDVLFNRPLGVRETRYIDGVGYKGFLFRPSIGIGQGKHSHFNFVGTVTKVNLKKFYVLRDKYHIYSGEPAASPSLPCVDDTLFIRHFFDKAHIKKEDSYISDYESESDDE